MMKAKTAFFSNLNVQSVVVVYAFDAVRLSAATQDSAASGRSAPFRSVPLTTTTGTE